MIGKIISHGEKERKEIRNKRIMVIFIGLIMVLSSASFAFLSFDKTESGITKKTYNDVEFTKDQYGYWAFTIQDYSFQTLFTPDEVENITVNIVKGFADYYGKPLYFGIDNITSASFNGNAELSRNLDNYITKTQFSCLSDKCTENYPIKNCTTDSVITFRESEKASSIKNEEGCVAIEYLAGEEEKAADAFIFRILGLR